MRALVPTSLIRRELRLFGEERRLFGEQYRLFGDWLCPFGINFAYLAGHIAYSAAVAYSAKACTTLAQNPNMCVAYSAKRSGRGWSMLNMQCVCVACKIQCLHYARIMPLRDYARIMHGLGVDMSGLCKDYACTVYMDCEWIVLGLCMV